MNKYIKLLILFLCLLTSINCYARPKKRAEPQTIEEKIIEAIKSGDKKSIIPLVKEDPYFMFSSIEEGVDFSSLDSNQKKAYKFVEQCYELSDMPVALATALNDSKKLKELIDSGEDINKCKTTHGLTIPDT